MQKYILVMEDYNIEVQPHHMLWYNNNFGFSRKECSVYKI